MKKKTIKAGLLRTLSIKNYLKAVRNTKLQGRAPILNIEHNSSLPPIYSPFTWSISIEGHDYWSQLSSGEPTKDNWLIKLIKRILLILPV